MYLLRGVSEVVEFFVDSALYVRAFIRSTRGRASCNYYSVCSGTLTELGTRQVVWAVAHWLWLAVVAERDAGSPDGGTRPLASSLTQRRRQAWWTHCMLPVQRQGATHSACGASAIVPRHTQQVRDH